MYYALYPCCQNEQVDWLIVIKIKVRSIINALTINTIDVFQEDEQHNQLPIAFGNEELHSFKDDLSALKNLMTPNQFHMTI